MTQSITSLNSKFLAKFILGSCKVGMCQTLSSGSPSLGPSTKAKIHSHIQRYFIQASKQAEEKTEEAMWIPVLKASKLSLLKNESSFSPLEKICRISLAIVNTKIKWNIPMLALLPDFRKAIQSKDKICKPQQHTTCLLCIWSSRRQAPYNSFSKSEMLSTSYIKQSKEIKINPLISM